VRFADFDGPAAAKIQNIFPKPRAAVIAARNSVRMCLIGKPRRRSRWCKLGARLNSIATSTIFPSLRVATAPVGMMSATNAARSARSGFTANGSG